jgi:hypothetical protein
MPLFTAKMCGFPPAMSVPQHCACHMSVSNTKRYDNQQLALHACMQASHQAALLRLERSKLALCTAPVDAATRMSDCCSAANKGSLPAASTAAPPGATGLITDERRKRVKSWSMMDVSEQLAKAEQATERCYAQVRLQVLR